jgi:hypothetical protein
MTETKTARLIAWDGETYKGASDFYEKFTTDPEFLEYTEDLDSDELLRLAIFAHNGAWGLVPEDMPLFIAQEQEAFSGDWDSDGDFAQDWMESTGTVDADAYRWLVIDWQQTYNYSLSHDYFCYDVIDLDGSYRRFYWNANI